MSKLAPFLCLLIVGFANCDESCFAQEGTGLKPFRSELWQLEYREDEEQRELPTEEAPGNGQSSRGGLVLVDINSPTTDALGISSMQIPGDTTIDEFTAQVPMADMQVESAISTTRYGIDRSPGDWEMSTVGVSSNPAGPVISTKGPTITTVLVGLVACIVMIGAFLTGRD